MKRASVIVLLVLLALMAVGPLGPAPVAAASRVAPKVAIVVGPVGATTPYYISLANQAAAAAETYTPNVVKVYSPDATWPAVKQALQGASIVIYLGHGNGWPSPYRNELTPSTQNGMGLNPNNGASTHQYFGEDRIGKEIKLAKDAVVIFSHLCYASGNSEPGLPEGSLDDGQQRVDNYAAGFIRAGAAAVIAEAYMGPAYYVKSILGGKSTVDRIWRSAPTYHGNLLRFDSLRSAGYTAVMDTDTPTAGFHRSIVLKNGLAAANVLAGAVRMPGGGRANLPPLEPTLSGTGVAFNSPGLSSPPTAGATTSFTFHLSSSGASTLPAGLMVGVRWDPLDGGATTVTPGASSPVPSPDITVAPPLQSPADPGASPTPDVDPVTLVAPEVLGDVVAPVAATVQGDSVVVPVRVPSKGGLYRLVGTIHGSDGVAYDAATQALMPALIVRVTGPLTAVYDLPSAAFATAGGQFSLHVGVTNLGAAAWGAPGVNRGKGGAESDPARRATIIARWVNLADGTGATTAPDATALLPAGLAPGKAADATFTLTAPKAVGDYLLLIDVITPRSGSLAVAGVPPGIVRVTVSGAVAPAP